MADFNIEVPTDGAITKIELNLGNALFVLGANGVGKSSLMQRLYSQNSGKAKRISAHRTTWFTDNGLQIYNQYA